MNASGPEAEAEYSRAHGAGGTVSGDPEAVWNRRFERHRTVVLVVGMLGALVLLVAEFTPVLHVHVAGTASAIRTVDTGSDDSFALVPIAILAAGLAISTWRSGSRLALLAIGVLGLVTLAIALLGDLPRVHSTGLVGNATTGLRPAHSSAAIGLFLEVAGGLILLLSAAGGMLLEPVPAAPVTARSAASTGDASASRSGS